MPLFKKKPVVIEAIQYQGYNIEEIAEFAGDDLLVIREHGSTYLKIATLEGTSYFLSDGDWVIKGVKGEFYPCKPDVFQKTYEPVDN